MKIEKWMCDRCKKEFDKSGDVLECRTQVVGIYPSITKIIHVCDTCGKKIGVEKPIDAGDAKSKADKLLDIIYDIVEEVHNDG